MTNNQQPIMAHGVSSARPRDSLGLYMASVVALAALITAWVVDTGMVEWMLDVESG